MMNSAKTINQIISTSQCSEKKKEDGNKHFVMQWQEPYKTYHQVSKDAGD